jgi:hypothetical protein
MSQRIQQLSEAEFGLYFTTAKKMGPLFYNCKTENSAINTTK